MQNKGKRKADSEVSSFLFSSRSGIPLQFLVSYLSACNFNLYVIMSWYTHYNSADASALFVRMAWRRMCTC
jgi:hypothetical protein